MANRQGRHRQGKQTNSEKQPAQIPTISKLQPIENEPEDVKPTDLHILYDSATLLNMLFQEHVELTQNGLVLKRITKRIMSLLTLAEDNDPEDLHRYINQLYSMLYAMEVVNKAEEQARPGKHYLVPGPHYGRWSRYNAVQQTYGILEGWHKGHNLAFLTNSYVDYDAHYIMPNYAFTYVRPAANIILRQTLRHCQCGIWYRLSDFLRIAYEEENQYYDGPLPNGKKMFPIPGYSDWLQMPAPLYVDAITGIYSDLALIELGMDNVDPLDSEHLYLRITQLGSDLITGKSIEQQADEPNEQEQEQEDKHGAIVKPDYEIILTQFDSVLLYQLLPFTRVKKIDQACTLQLSQSSIEHGLASGLNSEQILATLRECSRTEVPQNVLYSLQDWSRHYKVASITDGYLVEFPDDESATRASSSSSFAALAARQLTPRIFFILPTVSLAVLYKRLESEHIHVHYINARDTDNS